MTNGESLTARHHNAATHLGQAERAEQDVQRASARLRRLSDIMVAFQVAANVGDVVYAPQGRWHRASWTGNGMSTRIAINPRPYGMHNFDPDSGAKQ